MKIKLSILAFFLFVFFGAVTNSFGQTDQITGGYGEADVADAEVIKAAKFAVKKRSQNQKSTIILLSINKAQVQVVAGLNYEICLQVNVKKSGKKSVKQYVKTVVYRDLRNRYSLTSWVTKKESECEE